MPTYVAQIAPQRSTQYAALASALAPLELRLSPLREHLANSELVELGGQQYLKFELSTVPTAKEQQEMDLLAMVSGLFAFYEKMGHYTGPFLRPVNSTFAPALPPEIIETRRYRGKTNELFTRFLLNVARYSSDVSDTPWREMRILDPLMGGATTLFAGLVLGASVAGVEHAENDVTQTAAFLRSFLQEQRISHDQKAERLKGLGRRWVYMIGKRKAGQRDPQTCTLAAGDTVDAERLVPGFRPNLIVTDLPYGVQHKGKLDQLLTKALPIWAKLMSGNGALVFSWESTRFPREEMVRLVEASAPLRVLNEGPYNQLAHRVDRVIKQRDVLVARKT